jgi:hypothetical protein
MAWHRYAWDRVLATSAGRLVHRQALISTARQNGKTWWLQQLAGWWMLERALTHGPQSVAWVSHDLRLSEQAFLGLGRLLEPWTSYRTNSFGRERLELVNGSSLAVQSNTPGAGHGNTYHLVVADECWKLRPEAITLGLGPTQRAVKEPLMVLASTAGDENSTLLRTMRDRALAGMETGTAGPLAMLEWSMSPGVDPFDARRWGDPNPCLGTTLEAATLIAEAQGDRSAFLRGSLNIWTASDDSWLQPGVWDFCQVDGDPEPVGGVLACEVSRSWEGSATERFVAVRAWQTDGVTRVAVVASTEDRAELWETIAALYPTVDVLAITPTLELHRPDALKRKAQTVGKRELVRWVPLVRSMIHAGHVAHHRSQLLDEHVARSMATATAGLSARGDISLARCLVWAVALSSRPTARRRPAMATATV